MAMIILIKLLQVNRWINKSSVACRQRALRDLSRTGSGAGRKALLEVGSAPRRQVAFPWAAIYGTLVAGDITHIAVYGGLIADVCSAEHTINNCTANNCVWSISLYMLSQFGKSVAFLKKIVPSIVQFVYISSMPNRQTIMLCFCRTRQLGINDAHLFVLA